MAPTPQTSASPTGGLDGTPTFTSDPSVPPEDPGREAWQMAVGLVLALSCVACIVGFIFYLARSRKASVSGQRYRTPEKPAQSMPANDYEFPPLKVASSSSTPASPRSSRLSSSHHLIGWPWLVFCSWGRQPAAHRTPRARRAASSAASIAPLLPISGLPQAVPPSVYRDSAFRIPANPLTDASSLRSYTSTAGSPSFRSSATTIV